MNPETKFKQVIVMRHDLKMRRGKQIAQGAHTSMSFFSRRMQQNESVSLSDFTDAQRAWIEGAFAKVCCRVDSEEELDEIFEKASSSGLEVHLITDSVKTEFHGETLAQSNGLARLQRMENRFYRHNRRNFNRGKQPKSKLVCFPKKKVHPAGFEPATLGSEDRYSIQLNYGCVADKRDVYASFEAATFGRQLSSPKGYGFLEIFQRGITFAISISFCNND